MGDERDVVAADVGLPSHAGTDGLVSRVIPARQFPEPFFSDEPDRFGVRHQNVRDEQIVVGPFPPAHVLDVADGEFLPVVRIHIFVGVVDNERLALERSHSFGVEDLVLVAEHDHDVGEPFYVVGDFVRGVGLRTRPRDGDAGAEKKPFGCLEHVFGKTGLCVVAHEPTLARRTQKKHPDVDQGAFHSSRDRKEEPDMPVKVFTGRLQDAKGKNVNTGKDGRKKGRKKRKGEKSRFTRRRAPRCRPGCRY